MQLYDLTDLSVLVVDDSPAMRQLLGSLLRALGIRRLKTVESAEKAEAELALFRPDILLLDILMPGRMNGLDLCRRIRSGDTPVEPFVPVIIVSGYTDIHHIGQARDAGANEFLAKPISAQHLYSRFCALIKAPRPFVRAPSFMGPDRRRKKERRQYPDPPPCEDRRIGHDRREQRSSKHDEPTDRRLGGGPKPALSAAAAPAR